MDTDFTSHLQIIVLREYYPDSPTVQDAASLMHLRLALYFANNPPSRDGGPAAVADDPWLYSRNQIVIE
jgi:hypothetical protein